MLDFWQLGSYTLPPLGIPPFGFSPNSEDCEKDTSKDSLLGQLCSSSESILLELFFRQDDTLKSS